MLCKGRGLHTSQVIVASQHAVPGAVLRRLQLPLLKFEVWDLEFGKGQVGLRIWDRTGYNSRVWGFGFEDLGAQGLSKRLQYCGPGRCLYSETIPSSKPVHLGYEV